MSNMYTYILSVYYICLGALKVANWDQIYPYLFISYLLTGGVKLSNVILPADSQQIEEYHHDLSCWGNQPKDLTYYLHCRPSQVHTRLRKKLLYPWRSFFLGLVAIYPLLCCKTGMYIDAQSPQGKDKSILNWVYWFSGLGAGRRSADACLLCWKTCLITKKIGMSLYFLTYHC